MNSVTSGVLDQLWRFVRPVMAAADRSMRHPSAREMRHILLERYGLSVAFATARWACIDIHTDRGFRIFARGAGWRAATRAEWSRVEHGPVQVLMHRLTKRRVAVTHDLIIHGAFDHGEFWADIDSDPMFAMWLVMGPLASVYSLADLPEERGDESCALNPRETLTILAIAEELLLAEAPVAEFLVRLRATVSHESLLWISENVGELEHLYEHAQIELADLRLAQKREVFEELTLSMRGAMKRGTICGPDVERLLARALSGVRSGELWP